MLFQATMMQYYQTAYQVLLIGFYPPVLEMPQIYQPVVSLADPTVIYSYASTICRFILLSMHALLVSTYH